MSPLKQTLLFVLQLLATLTLADIVAIGEISTSSPKDRDEVAASLSAISDLEATNPSVPKYALFVPLQDDGTTLFTLEQYTTPAAFATHVALPEVQSVLTLLTNLNATVILSQLTAPPELSVAKDFTTTCSHWALIQATTFCRNEAVEEVLPAWKKVVDGVRKREGTMLYGVYPDEADLGRVMTVEVHESFGYFWGVHRRRGAVRRLERRLGSGEVKEVRGVEVRGVGGFLWKE